MLTLVGRFLNWRARPLMTACLLVKWRDIPVAHNHFLQIGHHFCKPSSLRLLVHGLTWNSLLIHAPQFWHHSHWYRMWLFRVARFLYVRLQLWHLCWNKENENTLNAEDYVFSYNYLFEIYILSSYNHIFKLSIFSNNHLSKLYIFSYKHFFQ